MNTNGHYTIKRDSRRGWIVSLNCVHCSFLVFLRGERRARDRSGQPRYNRGRAKMVRHLHQQHREILANENNVPPSGAGGSCV